MDSIENFSSFLFYLIGFAIYIYSFCPRKWQYSTERHAIFESKHISFAYIFFKFLRTKLKISIDSLIWYQKKIKKLGTLVLYFLTQNLYETIILGHGEREREGNTAMAMSTASLWRSSFMSALLMMTFLADPGEADDADEGFRSSAGVRTTIAPAPPNRFPSSLIFDLIREREIFG